MVNEGKRFYEFGPFRLNPCERLLWRDRQTILLQPKAFDTLLVLVQNSERLVLKDDLMKAVWPDSFVEESNLTQNIFVLRKILEDTPRDRRYIVTVPGRGYRFAEQVRTISGETETETAIRQPTTEPGNREEVASPARAVREGTPPIYRKRSLAAAAVLVLAAGGLWFSRSTPKLTEKDTIVLGDLANTTGDPVFDGTLRRGLAAQLEQSPFLNLLSDQRVAQTLLLMSRPKDTQLTQEMAHEVCLRTASAAVLSGAIARIGTRYQLTLNAIACNNGESLASAGAQAMDKNHVLDALGKIAAEIRSKLGESLVSVKKYDAPPESVTTPSLEALQAYSLGYQAMVVRNDGPAAIPLFQQAISLDPNFAMAYARLGTAYFNGEQTKRATENLQKAYELRNSVSEREKLYIIGHHEDIVTRDFDAARRVYESWAQIYPRDEFPLGNLGVVCTFLGDYDKALTSDQEARKLNPGNGNVITNVAGTLLQLNRLKEATTAFREAQALHVNPGIGVFLYAIGFLEHDAAAMEREAAALMGKPGYEDLMLFYESDTAAHSGHFVQARELTRRASDSARRSDNKEAGAAYWAESAVREALSGNMPVARQQARAALALSQGRDVEAISAIALGLAGEAVQASQLAGSLAKDNPQDTVVQFNALPAIKAASALRSDPGEAIDALAVSTPYEFGQTSLALNFCLYPAYLRGEAYLAAKQGIRAAAEFQKILDHPGLVQNEPIGAMARLGLGRARALVGDTGQAKKAYDEFLALWKDADSDIPMLKQAHAEYSRLP
jgi:DNA-binding winged helix-turn-helix (wHTH) protein/tetratricopeptide (TPR) repeat protein